jgi:hypothetical protein
VTDLRSHSSWLRRRNCIVSSHSNRPRPGKSESAFSADFLITARSNAAKSRGLYPPDATRIAVKVLNLYRLENRFEKRAHVVLTPAHVPVFFGIPHRLLSTWVQAAVRLFGEMPILRI